MIDTRRGVVSQNASLKIEHVLHGDSNLVAGAKEVTRIGILVLLFDAGHCGPPCAVHLEGSRFS